MDSNLRDLQSQLNAAIRAHRNLVGRANLQPHDDSLRLKVAMAERLIVRVYQAQKPLLEQYRRECQQGKLTSRCGQNGQQKTLATVDEVLDDSLRHHFCPSTLDRWCGSVVAMSPEKKRKVNFLGLFDLITPKLNDDIAESKSGPYKRRLLVNADFPLAGPQLDGSCKRLRGSAASLAASAQLPQPQPVGILTRSSRRTRGARGGCPDDSPAAAAAAAAKAAAASAEKSPESGSDTRQQSDSSADHRFCCASCHRVLPARAAAARFARTRLAPVEWCPECRAARDSRACGAIGLPTESGTGQGTDDGSTVSASGGDASNTSSSSAAPDDSLAAVELEHKALLREAELWERNLLGQEQRRQHLVEKNWRAEQKLEGLLAQLSKVNGM